MVKKSLIFIIFDFLSFSRKNLRIKHKKNDAIFTISVIPYLIKIHNKTYVYYKKFIN